MEFDGAYAAISLNGRKVCPGGSYLSCVDDVCIANTCPTGQILLQNNCTPFQFVSSSKKPADLMGTYSLVFQIINTTDTEAVAVGFFKCLFENIENPPELVNVSCDDKCSVLKSLQRYHGPDGNITEGTWSTDDVCATVTLVRQSALDTRVFEMIESAYQLASASRQLGRFLLRAWASKLREAGLPENAVGQIKVLKISLVNHFPKAMEDVQCPSERWLSYHTNNITLIEGSSEADDVSSFLGVIWEEIGLSVSLNDVPAVISWTPFLQDSIGLWHFDLWSSYCQPNILDCERVLLEKSSVILGQGWLKVKGYAMRIEQDMFALSDNGVFVCRSAVKEATEQKDDDDELKVG